MKPGPIHLTMAQWAQYYPPQDKIPNWVMFPPRNGSGHHCTMIIEGANKIIRLTPMKHGKVTPRPTIGRSNANRD